MQLFNTRSRKVLGTVVTCLIAGIATLAFAAWLTDGRGQGKVKVGKLQNLVVSPGATATGAGCVPGELRDATFSVQNPNNSNLVVVNSGFDDLQAGGPPTTSNPGCLPSNLTIQEVTGLSLALPKNATTDITVPGAFRLSAAAPSECQDAEFTYSTKLTATTNGGG